MKIKELKLNDIVAFDNRIYRVVYSKWKNGTQQGKKVILKLIRAEELNKLILNECKGVNKDDKCS